MSFLSTLHYIIFFGLVLLLTQSTNIRTYKNNNTCEIGNTTKVERIKEAPVATEDVTETLHSELLFRY